MIVNEKLNKKIAKWCGWKYFPEEDQDRRWLIPKPYNVWTWNCPNFTNSMDACVKWVIPKLHSKLFRLSLYTYINLEPLVQIDLAGLTLPEDSPICYRGFGETIPIAFCLVVEKLIDSESK
jgi:hypothetical protein